MSRKVTETLRVKGMFCPHCESTVSRCLLEVAGVSEAQASYRDGKATVTYDPELFQREEAERVVRDAGYELVDKSGAVQTGSILIILLALYVIARQMGWTNVFNLFPNIESGMELGMLFLVGLMTGIHCIAMCGGINLTQATMSSRGERIDGVHDGNVDKSGRFGSLLSRVRTLPNLAPNALYNLGRVISYTLTGALCGAIGQTIGFSGKLRGILPIVVGVIMLLMACNMLGLFRRIPGIRFRMPAAFYSWAAGSGKGRSSLVIGLLNGLMPCGPLQSMQLYALGTGSIIMGALSMFCFSLGTVPLMFGFGFLAGRLNRRYRQHMLVISALIIFLMGFHMIADGLAVSGASLQLPQGTKTVQQAMVKDGVQEVRTEIDYGSYPEIRVQKGIPVHWNIYVPEGKLNGCNGEILIPSYDLDIKLKEGDNYVEFTPTEAGNIPYSCWMGMIKSRIQVE